MKKSIKTIELPFMILDLLNKETDEDHIISMPEIIAMLEEDGYKCDRRTIYKAIKTLKKYNVDILYKQIHRKQGYYLKRNISEAEIAIIISSLYDNASLSLKDTHKIEKLINNLYSPYKTNDLYKPHLANNKTANPYVIKNISLIMQAIKNGDDVEFRYYDLSITKEKKYRKDKKKYILTPYALSSSQGKIYTIMYNNTYKTFNIYRLDKIDTLSIIEADHPRVPFNLDSYLRNSFFMYSGEAITITIKCPLDFSNIIFDQFGKDIIISKVTNDYFIASIRTSNSPTLISWLLQFYDKIEVIKPKEIIDKLKNIATYINDKY